MRQSQALLIKALSFVAVLSTPAFAMDTYHSAPNSNGFNIDLGVYLRGNSNNLEINKYFYDGHRMKMDYKFNKKSVDYNLTQNWLLDSSQAKNQGGTIVLECQNSPTAQGGWVATPQEGMTCWDPMYATSVYHNGKLLNNGNSVQIVGEEPLTANHIQITPKSQCDSAHYASPSSKKICIGGSGISVNTSDDMISVSPKAGAYLEYDLLGNRNLSGLGSGGNGSKINNRLKYISSNRASSDGQLSIPSGYTASSVEVSPEITEYYTFSQSEYVKGNANVDVKNGCYQADIKVCENVNVVGNHQYINGSCGEAHDNGFLNTGEILKSKMCKYGVPTSISTSNGGKQFNWKCLGVGANESASKKATDASCNAYLDMDAKCGTSNNEEFSSKTALSNAGKHCSTNSTRTSITGSESGPWVWECNSTMNNTTATCMALPNNKDCSDLNKNQRIVVVQDLSGSFIDDLGNTRSALKALFKNSAFRNWGVAITSFIDLGESGYKNHGGYYIVPKQLSTLTSVYDGLTATGGGDFPESQVYAMSKAIDDYAGASNTQVTLVLATDATSHTGGNYGTFAGLASKMTSKNVRVITLSTGQVSYYSENFNNSGVGHMTDHKSITSNSSDLGLSLMTSLLSMNCK